ncbi:3-deoxy-manno-octulosonate cytidylyltransferase [Halanaerobium hydrogeniformans]|uniref:3-deoxy-manno-octulosonate cytidylyltransferase n=1 Tax=Halanaerobium hydrogeniformans TaxID=656519 RepID=E4RJY0_HALHG|nr:3-deoxy-manno-octulosonate cytidylyltransferase [Halanaerobium hydrogeniformans]ADQ15550.1 3-deoxy-D-manno-octulosonate cytidylyltransferase [Halanaerobium hydrogeniformans]
MNALKTAAVIPARYDSSRFPAKALAKIAGKEMVVRVMEAVQKSELIDEVIVATDDQRIKVVVEANGGRAVMTSSEHQTGTDRIAEAAEGIEADLIVNVQGDEPLIKKETIAQAIKPFQEEKNLKMSTLKRRLDPKKAANPDIVKVVVDQDDYALYFSRSPIPYYRDDEKKAKEYFQHIGLYVYRRDFLLDYSAMSSTTLEKAESLEQLRVLESGVKIKVIETEAKLIGVDRKEDIELVEKELKKRNRT